MKWPLLEHLGEDDRRAFLAATHRRRFSKGEIVFHEGDAGDALHLLELGHVAVRITTPDGEVATLAVRGPGSHFGEMALVSHERRNATVVALEAVESLVMHRREFLALRREHRAIDELLVDALAGEVGALSRRLVDALYLAADKRIARQLVELVRVYSVDGGEVPTTVPLTQDDLASLAGTARPTANRVLKQLAADGAVVVHRGRIEVLDPAAVARFGR